MNKNKEVVKLSYCAICITLSFVFSKLTFLSLPFGGKITLFSMFIIALPGYVYGVPYGFLSSTSLGILKALFASHANHPASLILDYFMPYFVFGFTGLCKNKNFEVFEWWYVLCAFLRFISTSISGYFLWASYCPKGMNLLIYTIVYNGSYIGIEVMFTIIVMNIPTVKKLIKKLIYNMQK